MQEKEHLERIAEMIYLLEGEAASIPTSLPQVGEIVDEFLKLNHSAENDAILLYRTIINDAFKRGDTSTRRLFVDIVLQEEEHYWKFDDLREISYNRVNENKQSRKRLALNG